MKRRLTAILAADVVGYSRLMGVNESGTLTALDRLRSDFVNPKISEHQGRIVKLTGDGMLVEFPSVVNAVACATDMQRGIRNRNAGVPQDHRIQFRMGVNVGDVIVQGKDIFGDGVNVAARLESIATAGGIMISGSVRDHIGNRLDLAFEDMGEQSLKNIERPIRVYRVCLDTPAAPATKDTKTAQHEQVEKPAIAVLPFNNMSGDPEQEYFSDGITEDIITDLSKVSALSVIARNSAFAFKGKNVDVLQVARQLKVSHVLEGSVRKAGGRVRITAISEAIVKALKLKLLPEEKKAIEQRGTESVEAYNLFLMARQNYVTGGESDLRRAEATIRICQRVTEIDPNYADAWALMALDQMIVRFIHGGKGEDGLAAAERALVLDANLAEAHAVKARIFAENGRHDEASAEIASGLRLDPESFEVNRSAGLLSFRQHRLEDAIRYWEKATTLMETDVASPSMLTTCYAALGNSQATRRAAEITLARAEKVLAQDQNNGAVTGWGVNALAILGEAERPNAPRNGLIVPC